MWLQCAATNAMNFKINYTYISQKPIKTQRNKLFKHRIKVDNVSIFSDRVTFRFEILCT